MKDITLLKRLYSVEHGFREEYKMMSFIINYCHSELKDCKLNFEFDHYGNLFITKNTTNPDNYICIIAHTDAVQRYTTKRKICISGDFIFGIYKDGNKAGLAADDANGIFVALKLLKEIDNIKVLFTVEEESGGIGAQEASMNTDFWENVMFLLQADRRGSSDLITHTNGIDSANREFVEVIKPISKKYGYKENRGTFTDVGILAEELKLSGVNISCGYYNEHTDNEYTNYKELLNCYNYIREIIMSLKDSNIIYPIEVPKKFSYSSYVKNYTYPREFEDDLPCDYCKTFDCMNCTKFDNWH